MACASSGRMNKRRIDLERGRWGEFGDGRSSWRCHRRTNMHYRKCISCHRRMRGQNWTRLAGFGHVEGGGTNGGVFNWKRCRKKVTDSGGLVADGAGTCWNDDTTVRRAGNWKDNCFQKDNGSSWRHNLGLPFSLGSKYHVEIERKRAKLCEIHMSQLHNSN